MLQDLDQARDSEIQFINGEVVRRAKDWGVNVPVHEGLVRLVEERSREKKRLKKREEGGKEEGQMIAERKEGKSGAQGDGVGTMELEDLMRALKVTTRGKSIE